MSPSTPSATDVRKLRDLYKKSPTARLIFDHLASRQRNRQETTVDRIHALIVSDRHDVDRDEVIDFFRELENLHCGDFLVGRRGHPSRFEWSVEMTTAARAAAGEVDHIPALEPRTGPGPDATNALEHTFRLRPDFEVAMLLPSDLTPAEAQRLSDFIRTLPF
jgi:hypothetical protein